MKLLTVTIPAYNSQEYLHNCVESLLAGGERIEIIIVNDGSNDKTGEIADSYAERYPSIVKVVHQENGGHGEGINQGLKLACGKYFKVVDSDDRLSSDITLLLDKLEECEKQGGVDLLITNYRYTHSDKIGDKSIVYANAMPENEILTWERVGKLNVKQLFTIHSTTFRTECLRKSGNLLPKHTFYEDNYMVFIGLPYVEKLYYINKDLYLYTIGREGQSVQHDILKSRYLHQIKSATLCFKSFYMDELSRSQQRYMKHALFIMLAMTTLVTRLNRSQESDADLKKMWEECYAHDEKEARRLRHGTLIAFISLPSALGRSLSCFIYNTANKIVRFN